jgi:tetratricopeptide (TPR) repeat protein
MDATHAILIVLVVVVVVLVLTLGKGRGSRQGGPLTFTFRIGGKGAGLPANIVQTTQIPGAAGASPGSDEGLAHRLAAALLLPPGLQHKVGDVQELFARGLALGQQNQLDAAVAEFGKAVTLARHNLYASGRKLGFEEMIAAAAHNNLGNALLAKGDVDRAIVEFREGLKIAPATASLHDSLGQALAAKGDTGGADTEFREAARLDPNLAQLHANLADALAAKGEMEKAITEYGRALRINPELASAKSNLQAALEKAGTKPKPSEGGTG